MSSWFDTKKLHEGLKTLGLSFSSSQEEALRQYGDLVIEMNKVMNLTRIPEEEFITRHFLDSLSISSVIDLSKIKSLIDLGTGAGFPGIPILIAWPHLEVTLIDSTKKKISFIEEASKKIGLKVICVHGRAEEVAHDQNFREKFDLVTSRAVSELRILIELASGFVKNGGNIVAWKGEKAQEEVEASEFIRETLKLSKPSIQKNLILLDSNLIIYEKKGVLNTEFPRKYSALKGSA